MGQVVTEPSARVGKVWNGCRLFRRQENKISDSLNVNCFKKLFFELCLAADLREDQFYQLLQQLLGGHPGVEHGGDVLDICLKGPGGGTQVAEDIGDDIGQSWLAVVALAVIIKSLALPGKQREKS